MKYTITLVLRVAFSNKKGQQIDRKIIFSSQANTLGQLSIETNLLRDKTNDINELLEEYHTDAFFITNNETKEKECIIETVYNSLFKDSDSTTK